MGVLCRQSQQPDLALLTQLLQSFQQTKVCNAIRILIVVNASVKLDDIDIIRLQSFKTSFDTLDDSRFINAFVGYLCSDKTIIASGFQHFADDGFAMTVAVSRSRVNIINA